VSSPIARGPGSSEIPLVLLSLHGEPATGRLRVQREGVTRDLFLAGGFLVHADSSAPTDALEWLLFHGGVLSEERLGQVRSLIAGGSRRGRALLEMGAVTPQALCEWAERRARFLVSDTLGWRRAECQFEEGTSPVPGTIGVRLDTRALVVSALREGAGAPCLSARMSAPDDVLAPVAGADSDLAAHERYVMSLADGRRPVSEICFLSEMGEAETLRTLALLHVCGAIQDAAEPVPAARTGEPAAAGLREPTASALMEPLDVPAGDTTAEMRAAIRIYNDVYAGLCAYLIKEVGPIAEQLLDKHLRDARDQHAAIFSRAVPGRDGALPEDQIMRNVNGIRDQNRRDTLVAGLHGYLRAMVMAVRRILGPEHEAQVLRRLKELRCSRT
jgi:hypothetical protein